jgi:hypothetical protein
MCLGMAAMLSPVGDPVPMPVWTAVFVLCAAWFTTLLVRWGAEALHHVVSSGAMLFMLAAGHATLTSDGSPAAGHAAYGGLGSVVAIVLTGYFAWHALDCADRWRRCVVRQVGDGTDVAVSGGGAVALRAQVRSLRAPRLAAGAELMTAVAMALMLIGMV